MAMHKNSFKKVGDLAFSPTINVNVITEKKHNNVIQHFRNIIQIQQGSQLPIPRMLDVTIINLAWYKVCRPVLYVY